jgi:hypothetical protein
VLSDVVLSPFHPFSRRGGSGGVERWGRLRRPRRVLRYKRARDCLLGNFQPYLGVGPISIGKREQKNITAQNERYLYHIWHGGTLK